MARATSLFLQHLFSRVSVGPGSATVVRRHTCVMHNLAGAQGGSSQPQNSHRGAARRICMLAVKQAASTSLIDAAAVFTLCLRLHSHLEVEADALLLADGANVVDTAGACITGQLRQLECDVVATLADLVWGHQGRAGWELQQQAAGGTAGLSTCSCSRPRPAFSGLGVAAGCAAMPGPVFACVVLLVQGGSHSR